MANEDYEALLHMHKVGWEIWYNPAMHSYHQIPCSRLTREYLIRLVHDTGLGVCSLRMIGVKNFQKPVVILEILLRNLCRVILHLIKYRGQVKTDLVTACEMEFLLSGMVSPFYFLKRSMQNRLPTLKNT